MESKKDRVSILFAGFGIFLLLFAGYENYLNSEWQVISEFKVLDFTSQSIGLLLSPFVTALPAILIGYFIRSGCILYGCLFGILASMSVVIIDKLVFYQLIGSDMLFAFALVFSNYFIIAVLASGFGGAVAKYR